MQFELNESQQFLRDSARKFFAGEYPIAEVRRIMETETAIQRELVGQTCRAGMHLYYRRAKASETAFGDATFHRERLARMTIDAPTVSAQRA